MPRPKPSEPWITIPVRVTAAQRAALDAYRETNGLPTLADALRHMIDRPPSTYASFKAGRALAEQEVRHLDGDPTNNDLSNLKLAPVPSLGDPAAVERAMAAMLFGAENLKPLPVGPVDAVTGEPLPTGSRASPKGGKR